MSNVQKHLYSCTSCTNVDSFSEKTYHWRFYALFRHGNPIHILIKKRQIKEDTCNCAVKQNTARIIKFPLHIMSVSGPRNWSIKSVSGSRKETDKKHQPLDQETDVLLSASGSRNWSIITVCGSRCFGPETDI